MQFSKAILKNNFSILVDIKMHSPEHGDLLKGRNPIDIAKELEKAGAPALTNVTESAHYCGSIEILKEICESVAVPVIRKDFIEEIDDIKKTKETGAAGILLICSKLSEEKMYELYNETIKTGLEPLVEVHTAKEMKFVSSIGVKLIGINNRDILKYELDKGTIEKTDELIRLAPPESVIISESGIIEKKDVIRAKEIGANAVLVGSSVLMAKDITKAYKAMI